MHMLLALCLDAYKKYRKEKKYLKTLKKQLFGLL